MKRLRNHRREWLTKSDDIIITVKTRHIVKFFRYLFGYRARKRQDKKNIEIESTRLKHIAEQHQINRDRAWR